jgi:hypothetical protein
MAQPLSRPTLPQPFSEAHEPTLASGKFWVWLLTYRPLFLLGGVWLVLVCISAIAYRGLMFNEPVEPEDYARSPLTTAPSTRATLPPAEAWAAENAPPLPEETGDSGVPVTLWGLVSLVGLCSFGCFVLTQQIKAAARPKRKRKRKPTNRRPGAKVAPPPSATPRLDPYSPQRDSLVVPGVRIDDGPLLTPPRSAAPPLTGRQISSSLGPRKSTIPSPQGQGLPVSSPAPVPPTAVVPDDTDLPLDWAEGSVAHALDMRQRRSLSSFM